MSYPIVTTSDADRVAIMGYLRDDPTPILIESVRLDKAEARITTLSREMSPDWVLVAWHKVEKADEQIINGKRVRVRRR